MFQGQCVLCCHSQKERGNSYVFSAAENDATFGGAAVKSGKAYHGRVAATGKERSPSVARRVTGTTSVDDEDDRRRRRDWTSVTRCRLSAR